MRTPTPEIHAPRRHPAAPDGPFDLDLAATELLEQARSVAAGRAGRTLTPGSGATLKQSLLALRAGSRLQDHIAPEATTLLGIRGTAILHHGAERVTLTDGIWASCPAGRHTLEAVSDTVVLLTVAGGSDQDRTGSAER
jgi:quercetin dioxygenase-like cupin family protein